MILIAGDSYSDSNHVHKKIEQHYFSWSNELLHIYYDSICVAASGEGNWDIKRQLSRYNNYSLAIVSVSYLSRLPIHLGESRKNTLTEKQITHLNLKWAREICELPNTYVWTLFPGYETVEKVDFLKDLTAEDGLVWDKTLNTCVTGNHLTLKGNIWMINHMQKIINQKLTRVHNVNSGLRHYKNYTPNRDIDE